MKKKYMMFILVFIITLGYAAVSTKVELIGKTDIKYNEEDFRVEITSLKVNNILELEKISEDKQSFKYQGSGNEVIEYTVTNYSYQYDVKINLICNPSAGIEIEQIGELKGQSKENRTIISTSKSEVTCTIGIEKISRTDYAEDMCKVVEGQEWTFNYTGSEQEFVVPCDGEYKIELWGAQGGATPLFTGIGGKGAYVSGESFFSANYKFYLYIGEKGEDGPILNKLGGYNGGGGNTTTDGRGSNGGGSTDIRLKNGEWNNFNSLKSRIMVAGAGGGSGISNTGSYGGMVLSKLSNLHGGNGTQTSGGLVGTEYTHDSLATAGGFGYGGDGGRFVVGAGGSGYYGGAGGQHITPITSGGGGGGSSFISGHNGCDAISESSTETNIIHTGKPYHYSGLKFKNTVMIDGAGYSWTNVKGAYTGMPSHDGKSTMTGNSGHGYAKITYLGK